MGSREESGDNRAIGKAVTGCGGGPGGIPGNREESAGPRQAIMEHLEHVAPGDFVILGRTRPDAIANWSDRVTTQVIISGGARAHYRGRHPEVMDHEWLVVEAVLDPEEVHADASYERTSSFFKAIDDRYDLVVSVWISNDPHRLNAVKSARKQRVGDRKKGRALGHEVWRK